MANVEENRAILWQFFLAIDNKILPKSRFLAKFLRFFEKKENFSKKALSAYTPTSFYESPNCKLGKLTQKRTNVVSE